MRLPGIPSYTNAASRSLRRHTPTTTHPLQTQLAGNRAHSLFKFLRRGCNFATPSAAQDGSSATREGERDRVREREREGEREIERGREKEGEEADIDINIFYFFLSVLKQIMHILT